MIMSNLCNYSDAYIRAKLPITVPNTATQGATVSNTNDKVIFKGCALFTSFVSKINNAQVDHAQDMI